MDACFAEKTILNQIHARDEGRSGSLGSPMPWNRDRRDRSGHIHLAQTRGSAVNRAAAKSWRAICYSSRETVLKAPRLRAAAASVRTDSIRPRVRNPKLGLPAGVFPASSAGHVNSLNSSQIIQERAALSNNSDLTVRGISTALLVAAGGECVMGRTAIRVAPASICNEATTTQGLNFRPDSSPASCSLLHKNQ